MVPRRLPLRPSNIRKGSAYGWRWRAIPAKKHLPVAVGDIIHCRQEACTLISSYSGRTSPPNEDEDKDASVKRTVACTWKRGAYKGGQCMHARGPRT